ncbi:MAG: hypothetical protein WC548_04550 [Candidatus Pacearchaeota archaeon]
MRLSICILVFLFLASIVAAADRSSTRSDFSIAGCDNGLALDTCSLDRRNYCGSDGISYNTLQDVNGCSFGEDSYTSGRYCCPDGFVCTNDDGPICVQRTIECISFSEEDECEDNSCSWLDNGEGGECYDNPNDNACGFYQTDDACVEDVYNLGQMGIGAEGCSGYYEDNCGEISFVVNGCKCEWDEGSDRCELSKNITQEIYGTNPIKLQCKQFFETANCVEGKRHIVWESDLVEIFTGATATEEQKACLKDKLPCNNGSEDRDCGKPLLKLSGFSLFSLVISFMIIMFAYYFKKNN